ncbi:MAG: pyruvate dehydrogenase (acetyl-transferring), homodimeric type, partial [Gammaproteobacteria bacterium]|nr:pyruvate dehydrogenase (acetyl-transferring), homodimeric type [Gammaproteobacteria bacterium]
CLKPCKKPSKQHVQLMGSGTILREVEKAAELLEKDFSVSSDVWSMTSFTEVARDGMDNERHQRLNPTKKETPCYVEAQLSGKQGPVIAATDYMRAYADQIRPYVKAPYVTLGTDGYGRSDTRQKLRHFFEVDAKFIVLAALKALVGTGDLPASAVTDAIKRYKIDPNKLNPATH